jgi:predicted acylesterase/phospholipase RssA
MRYCSNGRKPRPRCHTTVVYVVALAALSGCASSSKIINQPLSAAGTLPSSQPAVAEADGDGWFVGLALSGGGSRSSNFAAACMLELQQIGLLQRVDYVSAVSGGALAAAYYCAMPDPQWQASVVQERLSYPFARDALHRAMLPWNALWLGLSDWDRSDVLVDEFNEHLFKTNGKPLTYADLRKDRPRLLLNATDLETGRRFVFCPRSFAELGSDLGRYPLASAVMASAAVPVLLHPVTLRDYSTAYRQYRHLVDGGVADNLGVRSLIEAYEMNEKHAQAQGRPSPYPKGVILIAIDARIYSSSTLSDAADPSLVQTVAAAARSATSNMINRISMSTLTDAVSNFCDDQMTVAQLRQGLKELKERGYAQTRDAKGRPIHIVHLALSRTRQIDNLPFDTFAHAVDSIGTDFNIKPRQAHHLYQAAKVLMSEHYGPILAPLARQMQATEKSPQGK